MNNRDRFRNTMNFEPVDRLPIIEWASWWNKTIDRWRGEGLPEEIKDGTEIMEYFGLDPMKQFWIGPRGGDCPRPAHDGGPIISDRSDYQDIKKYLYPDDPFDSSKVEAAAARQKTGELIVWITLEGYFWYPRTLFGIEPHLYSFYDHPDLMKEMNEDLLQYNLRVLEQFCEICTPDFMTFAEDMSYNHGPMLSKVQFDEFMAPYYTRITPELKRRGITVIVDTDGDITDPAAWFLEVGVEGLLPLERMAGVDVAQLRERHPNLRMIGAFDKTVMHLGEDRVRQEFERLLPVMRQGGYIPSVDHQTPPGVSMEQYRDYVRLLKEYCQAAGN